MRARLERWADRAGDLARHGAERGRAASSSARDRLVEADPPARVAEAARRGVEHLCDTLWGPGLSRRARAGRTFAAVVCALAVATIAAAVAFGGEPSHPGDVSARARMEAFRERLGDNRLSLASADLPEGVVGRYAGPTHGGGELTGTVARRSSSGACIGFEVRVGSRFLIGADPDALHLGEVTALGPESCRPTALDPAPPPAPHDHEE